MHKLEPLSVTISEWIEAKCRFLGKPGHMFPELILADLLYESENLTWPLSKEYYGNRQANNLTKIVYAKGWSGKSIIFNGIPYKTYRDWLHFASDYSDILCFTDAYDDFLKLTTLEEQAKNFKNGRYAILINKQELSDGKSRQF